MPARWACFRCCFPVVQVPAGLCLSLLSYAKHPLPVFQAMFSAIHVCVPIFTVLYVFPSLGSVKVPETETYATQLIAILRIATANYNDLFFILFIFTRFSYPSHSEQNNHYVYRYQTSLHSHHRRTCSENRHSWLRRR
jgi:hypothetical protein